MSKITELLSLYRTGDADAFDELYPLIEKQLRQIADRKLRQEKSGHTLQPADLVNEMFILLLRQKDKKFENRAHFYAVAALAMRQILVGYARTRNAQKRGGRLLQVTFNENLLPSVEGLDVLQLDQVLKELAEDNPRQAKIVEYRFFSGLSVDEVAELLCISARSVKRDWMVAKAWIYSRLREADPGIKHAK